MGPPEKRFRILMPEEAIINTMEFNEDEVKYYHDCRDNYINVDDNLEQQFSDALTADKLFDHSFLEQYIPEYRLIFYSN